MLAKSESNSPLTPESKQGSPFYAEPADAIAQNAAIIPRRRPRNNPATNKYRHSEPGWLQTPVGANFNQLHPIDWEESEETEDKTPLISSSVDNLAKRLGTKETKKIPRAKPVQPPKIRTKVFNDTSWAVDSSWEFIGKFAISYFYFLLFTIVIYSLVKNGYNFFFLKEDVGIRVIANKVNFIKYRTRLF